jgi:thymidylate kinase
MKIVAFSGLANTGKTTVIKRIADYLLQRKKSVLVLNETARKYYAYKNNRGIFQSKIAIDEQERLIFLENLKKNNHNVVDFVLCDRTCYDQYVYIEYDRSLGLKYNVPTVRHKNLYDVIFLFDEQIYNVTDRSFLYQDQKKIKELFYLLMPDTNTVSLRNSADKKIWDYITKLVSWQENQTTLF